jgi:fido (protein-threonine AMPylation protein)
MSETVTCAPATVSTLMQNMHSEVDEGSMPLRATWQPNTSWIKETEILTYICTWDDIQNFQRKLVPFISILKNDGVTAHFKEFLLAKTATLIWRGNRLETGRDCGTQEHILAAVKSLQESDIVDATSLGCDKTWDPEGDLKDPEGWKCMGEQAARGYFLLQVSAERGEPLTVEYIKTVHSILMSGGMSNCGQFRNASAFADDYVFAPHDDIERRMDEMVDSFEKSVASVGSYAVRVAVQLMLDFVTIHPFSNGNGRMCRLLFSYALQRMGFPFPVTLDSGFSKSYKHYITALKHAQTRSKVGPILQLALLSINATLTNYETFSQNPKLN